MTDSGTIAGNVCVNQKSKKICSNSYIGHQFDALQVPILTQLASGAIDVISMNVLPRQTRRLVTVA